MQYRFVALDLETTGLDPNTDTIIEVAAISFSLETLGTDILVNIDDKRSMLINPSRELTEEVTLITKITDEMLAGKPKWNEVQERVKAFIGEDTIIVGHNVLFDIAMLRAHDIDLSSRTVLDTFELAELFSQDMESLNLGFLCENYGFHTSEGEHRALGDVHLSIALFEKYLNVAKNTTERKKSILRLMGEKEEKPSMSFFNELIGNIDGEVFVSKYETLKNREESLVTTPTSKPKNRTESCISLDGNRETEIDFLLSQREKHKQVTILVANKKIQSFLSEMLGKHGYKNELAIDATRFCSLIEVENMLEQSSWERKMTIFVGKLLWWLEETETGLLEELKFYNEERKYIRWFRLEPLEYSPFRERHELKQKQVPCIIGEMSEVVKNPENINAECVIVKDIPLFEDIVRKNQSVHISIEELSEDLRNFPNVKNLLYTIYLIVDMYEHVPDRPTGVNPLPPGDFGETYFFTQEKLWETKGKWLVLFSRLLLGYHHEWKNARKLNTRRERLQAATIDKQITAIINYGLGKSDNIGTIIHMREDGTHIRFIPRNVMRESRKILMNLGENALVTYGYRLDGQSMRSFLMNECGVFENPVKHIEGSSTKKHLTIIEKDTDISVGSVILGTSQKQIRELGKKLAEKYTDARILIQGISGGKGKILSIYLENPENSVLLGTIDQWKDEFELWGKTKSIHILKLPFDPPSDPYFLARTVGMSDNFAHYSQPMAIIRINTLIGRIRSAGYRGTIFCHDNRLEETIWGREIAREIL